MAWRKLYLNSGNRRRYNSKPIRPDYQLSLERRTPASRPPIKENGENRAEMRTFSNGYLFDCTLKDTLTSTLSGI